MMCSRASGHAFASSHAVCTGLPMSCRPCTSTAGIPASLWASRSSWSSSSQAPLLKKWAQIRTNAICASTSRSLYMPGMPLGSSETTASSQASQSAAAFSRTARSGFSISRA